MKEIDEELQSSYLQELMAIVQGVSKGEISACHFEEALDSAFERLERSMSYFERAYHLDTSSYEREVIFDIREKIQEGFHLYEQALVTMGFYLDDGKQECLFEGLQMAETSVKILSETYRRLQEMELKLKGEIPQEITASAAKDNLLRLKAIVNQLLDRKTKLEEFKKILSRIDRHKIVHHAKTTLPQTEVYVLLDKGIKGFRKATEEIEKYYVNQEMAHLEEGIRIGKEANELLVKAYDKLKA